MATGLGGHIVPRDETSGQLSSNSWGRGPGFPRDDDMQPAATCLSALPPGPGGPGRARSTAVTACVLLRGSRSWRPAGAGPSNGCGQAREAQGPSPWLHLFCRLAALWSLQSPGPQAGASSSMAGGSGVAACFLS